MECGDWTTAKVTNMMVNFFLPNVRYTLEEQCRGIVMQYAEHRLRDGKNPLNSHR
jgi:hypothetical protein